MLNIVTSQPLLVRSGVMMASPARGQSEAGGICVVCCQRDRISL